MRRTRLLERRIRERKLGVYLLSFTRCEHKPDGQYWDCMKGHAITRQEVDALLARGYQMIVRETPFCTCLV